MKLSLNKKVFRYTLGAKGESLAAAHLEKLGFRILRKNYRCRVGEIDLIAEKSGRIHFVEIKTRSGCSCGSPEEAVDAKKQAKLVRLADWYLTEQKLHDPKVSLDVIAVTWREKREPEVRFIEGAFERQEE